ncbi:hypothetical protein AAIR98_000869 [Elusimicrobium simillimum]
MSTWNRNSCKYCGGWAGRDGMCYNCRSKKPGKRKKSGHIF